MHHSYLDKYARQNSRLHRLDARIKLPIGLTGVVLMATTMQPGGLFIASCMIFVAGLCAVARIPLSYLLSRSLIVLPFSAFAALSLAWGANSGDALWHWGPLTMTQLGLERSATVLLRAWTAISLMILLINTTPFDRLLRALRWYRMPAVLILLLSFLYRYLYLLWDEVERMQRARNMRYFGGRWREQTALLGNLAASLFLRSYERAERVQKAMLGRGWNGEAPLAVDAALPLKDALVMLGGLIVLFLLWCLRRY